jgi:hypothetical protein
MAYYKTIEGKKYDGELIDMAEKMTAGSGDGRISMEDAQKLYNSVKDGDSYTDTEKETIAYIRDKFKWTDAADEWFRAEIRKWAAVK